MSKCGPVNSQSARASSELPIHSPLRVPTISTVLVMPRILVLVGPLHVDRLTR